MNHELILDQLINTVPQYIFWKDRSGAFQGCNIAFAQQFGFNEKDLIGKTDHDFFWAPYELRAKYMADDQAVMNSGVPKLNYEEEQRQPDGSIKTILINKVPIRDATREVIGILGTYLDVTELKRAQQEAAEAQAKIAAEEATRRAILIFSGMQSHDLRTPLAAITAATHVLEDDLPALIEGYKVAKAADLKVPPLSAESTDYLQKVPTTILQCIDRTTDYIKDSLKSIRGASGGDETLDKEQFVSCNAGLLLQRVIREYPYATKTQKNKMHLDSMEFFYFMGNEIVFNRLMENLIKNAFEQIQLKGHGEIFVKCERAEPCNIIRIKDTAGGATQDTLAQFFTGLESTKEGGTGIGLFAAKQGMQSMGGDISGHLVDGDCVEFLLSFPQENNKVLQRE